MTTGAGPVGAALHRAAGAALLDAYAGGQTIPPISETYPHATTGDAYRIQQVQVAHWIAGGDRVRGHKVGLTSAAVQRQAGVDQPDYGHLTQSMFHLEHRPIPPGRFVQPRIEPEIAFVLGRALRGPGVTVPEAIAAVDFVLPALEIVDSRVADWRIGIVDTIADNASSGGVVLGSTPVLARSVDLRLAGCVVHHNGSVAATGAGGAVLGSPISSLVWLADTLGALGTELEAGDVVLPGSMTPTLPVGPGDTVTATVAGLGSVTAVLGREEDR